MQWKSSSPGWRGVSYSVVESSGNVLIEVSGVWGREEWGSLCTVGWMEMGFLCLAGRREYLYPGCDLVEMVIETK